MAKLIQVAVLCSTAGLAVGAVLNVSQDDADAAVKAGWADANKAAVAHRLSEGEVAINWPPVEETAAAAAPAEAAA